VGFGEKRTEGGTRKGDHGKRCNLGSEKEGSKEKEKTVLDYGKKRSTTSPKERGGKREIRQRKDQGTSSGLGLIGRKKEGDERHGVGSELGTALNLNRKGHCERRRTNWEWVFLWMERLRGVKGPKRRNQSGMETGLQGKWEESQSGGEMAYQKKTNARNPTRGRRATVFTRGAKLPLKTQTPGREKLGEKRTPSAEHT